MLMQTQVYGSLHVETYTTQDKKLVAGMAKEVKKVDARFFQSKGASENTLFRKRNFLATDEDEVRFLFVYRPTPSFFMCGRMATEMD